MSSKSKEQQKVWIKKDTCIVQPFIEQEYVLKHPIRVKLGAYENRIAYPNCRAKDDVLVETVENGNVRYLVTSRAIFERLFKPVKEIFDV